MKKKLLSLFLTLTVLAGLLVVPAGAEWALPASVDLETGESIEIRTDGLARGGWRWSCSNASVVDWDNDDCWCRLTGLRPGTAVITVKFTKDNGFSPAYEVTETCIVTVKAPDTSAADTPPELEPLVTYGKTGDYVGDIIDDIRGFNAGVVPVRYKGLWGLANAEMQLVLPFQFEDTNVEGHYEVTENGHFVARLDGRPYVINTKGEVIFSLPAGYTGLRVSYNMITAVRYSNGFSYAYYYIDGRKRNSEEVTNLRKLAGKYYNGLGDLIQYVYYDGYKKYGEEHYNNTYYGSCAGNPDVGWPSLTVEHCEKKLSERLQEGVIVAQDYDTKLYGLVDTKGNELIPCVYDKLYNSRGGYLAYQKGDKFGLLENPVNPPSGAAVKPATPTAPATPAASTTPTAPATPTTPTSPFTIEDGVLTRYKGSGGAVAIPSSVSSIGDDAFFNCGNVTSVTIPGSVTSIGRWAFYNCAGLTDVTIPDGVTKIANFTFCKCANLTSVTIPVSVTEIGVCAFDDCTSLKDVYYGGSEAQWKAIAIVGYSTSSLITAAIHYS